MNLYEIVNPSDAVTFRADNDAVEIGRAHV